MHTFTAHRLRFVAEVTRPIVVQDFPGSALRGALFRALIDGFCANRPALDHGGCPTCPLFASCPVAYLAATLDPQSDRGENVPRPFTLEPPLLAGEVTAGANGAPTTIVFDGGARFEFGLTMFAHALQLFPYVVLAVGRMGEAGLGMRTGANGWRRGQFAVGEIWADNGVTGEGQPVLQRGSNLVTMPDVPITHAQLAELPVPPPGAAVRVSFLTPLRLKHGGQVVHTAPPFRALFQRLMERVSSLAQTFSDTPLDADLRYRLVGLSDSVRTVESRTRWVHLEAYSGRQKGHTSISGVVGHVVYAADDWAPLWPWLKWGEITHVGKNAVKGEGMIRVTEEAMERGGVPREEAACSS
ncbi:MAG: CRISPR system precrRNA processing endoribonuclease RAMP protein Cas6 [Anaerolineae bacterium]